MTKRWSTIPVLKIPSFGQPFPKPKRAYDNRRVRKARLLKLAAQPTCERCGVVAVHVHHRTPIQAGGHPYDFANLESLCLRCHQQEHAQRPRRERPPRGG
jgi:5-methylcytosine-specific restriction endonuclease McrA